ncbi:MAG: proteasome subunit beta, partial [Actinobacteria bacterium]|nr:proteasome subunit beta [Actinomycetota bacterium]NBU07253.1 proteasome subunit beta [Acidimicrobiia bacterium]
VASIDANGWSRVSDESLASTYEAIMREVRSR